MTHAFTYSSPLIAIRRRWRIVLLLTLLGAGAAVAYAFTVTPQYESNAQLFVAAQQNSAQDLTNDFQGNQFTAARVQSYVELIKSPEITRPVIARLGLNLTPNALAQKLTASAPQNTVLINLTTRDPSPRRAQAIMTAVASRYIAVIDRLESAGSRSSSPVKVSVSNPASLGTVPVSPRKRLDVLLGLIVGLVVGVALAQAVDRIDDSIKSTDELRATLNAPVLAEIPTDSASSKDLSFLQRHQALGRKASGRAEALRTLRTNLQFVDVDNPPDCVVVTSCIPGEGKTTISSSLSVVLADAGVDVVLVEGDLRRPRLAGLLGLDPGVGLAGAIVSEAPASRFIQSVPGYDRFRVLLAGLPVPNPSELLGSTRMQHVLAELRADSDLVIIDAPPLLPVTDAALLASHASGALVVVELGRATWRDLDTGLASLNAVNSSVLGVVANRAKPPRGTRYSYGYAPLASASEEVQQEDRGAVGDPTSAIRSSR